MIIKQTRAKSDCFFIYIFFPVTRLVLQGFLLQFTSNILKAVRLMTRIIYLLKSTAALLRKEI